MTKHQSADILRLSVAGASYFYYNLKKAKQWGKVDSLPKSLKILLENLLRFEDGACVTNEDIQALAGWTDHKTIEHSIAYHPARILMQDFTGVPAVVDLAAMREAMKNLSADPQKINPLVPVDLVIDHSVNVDQFASHKAFAFNVQREFQRNRERYEFLKWGQKTFENFRVVPPGTGICHQVNLEYLSKVVWMEDDLIYPDTLVGTDSHTTMVNGLSVLGWGVGGIEAESAMLGQPITILIPKVLGVYLTGELQAGCTATDLVLYITQKLREQGVVGQFVEFYGPSLKHLSLADRATIANMAPEYGATCGFFPIDQETLNYLKLTGRSYQHIALVKAYAQAQGLWWNMDDPSPDFSDVLEIQLSKVTSSLAGPFRPQDRIDLKKAKSSFQTQIQEHSKTKDYQIKSASVEGEDYALTEGDVVIAAITSCTNTSNPYVMIAAGLMAKKANQLGLKVKPYVKTSLAPGSQVVTEYLKASGLQKELDQCGFHLVGYGCTTCIGNSGPMPPAISKAIKDSQLVVCSVLSGNRNFEGRVHPQTRFNYLASPPLVIAYALAGSLRIDLYNEPLGLSSSGNPVYLKDIWPDSQEVQTLLEQFLTPDLFLKKYADIFKGSSSWQGLTTDQNPLYAWKEDSTYIKKPPFFKGMSKIPARLENIKEARILAVLGDHVTTDHISPAGAIPNTSPAGEYLKSKGLLETEFNSFGARRGNHKVMMRGTFGNIRLKNKMVQREGGFTKFMGDQQKSEDMTIFEAAMAYMKEGLPLVVFAGHNYGMGSSRDWAAKGTGLLGVRAVIAKSFERIHRSNLIGMGVLPLQMTNEDDLANITGQEKISIVLENLGARQTLNVEVEGKDGVETCLPVICRIDTHSELEYYQHGGILQFVLRQLADK